MGASQIRLLFPIRPCREGCPDPSPFELSSPCPYLVELINATRMTVGYTMGVEPSGRELLVVVIKGTFALPKPGEEVRLHETQLPLVMADTFTGEPGLSSPVYEADFAPRKPMCDVLLIGSAHVRFRMAQSWQLAITE